MSLWIRKKSKTTGRITLTSISVPMMLLLTAGAFIVSLLIVCIANAPHIAIATGGCLTACGLFLWLSPRSGAGQSTKRIAFCFLLIALGIFSAVTGTLILMR